MNGKIPKRAWLGGLLLFLSGCAFAQVSSYFLNISQGDVRVEGYATIEEAAVAAEASVTQANWTVKTRQYETDRVVLEGTTRGGKPFKIVFTPGVDGTRAAWVQAKLDLAGSEMVELQAIFPAVASRREAPKKDTPRDNTAGAKK